MTSRCIMWFSLLGMCLLPLRLQAQDWRGGVNVRAPYNSPPFQNFLASPSAALRFSLSERGQQMQRIQPQEITEVAPAEKVQILREGIRPNDAGTVSSICGTSAGTRFNREQRANAEPQTTQAVDFLPNRAAAGVDLVVGGSVDWRSIRGGLGGSNSGYYVSRDKDCAAEFEGGLPEFFPPAGIRGGGNPVVAADSRRDAFFMADSRTVGNDAGIGLFRTTAATLLNTATCPSGTHTATQAAACWPTKQLLSHRDSFEFAEDNPRLAVDERANGTGAGNVYVTATEFDFSAETSRIWLVACTTNLAACSPVLIISGADTDTQSSHLAVRPDGGITITYLNAVDFGNSFEIKHVRCTPVGAPGHPTCAPPTLVYHETQPLRFGMFLGAQEFYLTTHPQHDHRKDTNGTETYVVWERCRVAPLKLGLPNDALVCPDADVVMKASRNDGLTWSALTCLACVAEDQFMPSIKTDRSRNIVNLALYSSAIDPTFQHRVRILIYHINPGSATPDLPEPHIITTLPNDPSGDPRYRPFYIFTDYIGVAARGTGVDGQSRAYAHYTYNNIQGVYSGVNLPEQNNHLSRLDY